MASRRNGLSNRRGMRPASGGLSHPTESGRGRYIAAEGGGLSHPAESGGIEILPAESGGLSHPAESGGIEILPAEGGKQNAAGTQNEAGRKHIDYTMRGDIAPDSKAKLSRENLWIVPSYFFPSVEIANFRKYFLGA